jgi:hypothetical protein
LGAADVFVVVKTVVVALDVELVEVTVVVELLEVELDAVPIMVETELDEL